MNPRIRSMIGLFAWAAGAVASAQSAAGNGEVRKIDAAQQKITLQHNGLPALDMPPMAMAFRVKDAASLNRIAVGDQVAFTVDKIDGTYTVTQIRKTGQ